MLEHYVQSHNISIAWANAFTLISNAKNSEIPQLIVSVEGFDEDFPSETIEIRHIVDRFLEKSHKPKCDTVANTIFPESLWNPEATREQLYSRYSNLMPRLRRICPLNANDTYFERLINFRSKEERNNEREGTNQLEHIINTVNTANNHRHSALIAAIFNPDCDHNDARRHIFPCMHEVTFELLEDKGLGITGIYATQYYFSKAYGNLLGLYRLGRFMAHALDRRLLRVTCMTSLAKLDPFCIKDRAANLNREILPFYNAAKARIGGLFV